MIFVLLTYPDNVERLDENIATDIQDAHGFILEHKGPFRALEVNFDVETGEPEGARWVTEDVMDLLRADFERACADAVDTGQMPEPHPAIDADWAEDVWFETIEEVRGWEAHIRAENAWPRA